VSYDPAVLPRGHEYFALRAGLGNSRMKFEREKTGRVAFLGGSITAIMGEAMTEFLDLRPGDKPFCLSVSFDVPHGSQVTSMFPDYPEWRQMTLPANENPKLKGHLFCDTLYRDITVPIPSETGTDPYRLIPKFILDQDKGRRNQTYPYNYTIATNREHHIRYYQTISGLDHIIGQLRADLERRGLAQNTIILFASDHGLIMGEYGMGGKELLLDLEADPGERTNLATAPAQAAILADLRARVATHSASINQRRTDFTRLCPPEPRRPTATGKSAPAAKDD